MEPRVTLTVGDAVNYASDENPSQEARLRVLVMIFLKCGVAIHYFVFNAMLLV